MTNLDTLCYIQEQTSSPEDYKTPFGYTLHERGNRFFLIFDAVLQSFEVMNRNKRMYLAENIMDKINNDEYIQTMLRQNSWMGEIDHPAADKLGEELTLQRISNPDLKLSSHFIRKPHLNGNLLEAVIQTDSSNENGMNMAIKIVDGKIIPCYSARVLGEMKNQNGRPIVFVRKLITYDWVAYGSHREAQGKLNQPIQEKVEELGEITGITIINFKELAHMAAANSRETQWLCESFGLNEDDILGVTSTGNSIAIKENSNIYVQPISDKFIRRKTQSTLSNWLNK